MSPDYSPTFPTPGLDKRRLLVYNEVVPKNQTPKTCRYCNGTGHRPEVAHVDGGRCWHCGPGNDINYDAPETMDEINAKMLAAQAERRAARAARRTALASRAG